MADPINLDEVFKFKNYGAPLPSSVKDENYLETLADDISNYRPFSATVKDPSRNLKQGSLDWFAERAKCDVTASEFSAAAGRNYFKSRSELVQDKLTNSHFDGNEATRWGQENELNAIKWFEGETGHRVSPTGLWHHPMYKNIGGSPDGLIYGADGTLDYIIEVKCPYSKRDFERLPNYRKCPQQYRDQIQGLCEICCPRYGAILIVWTPKSQRVVTVERDEVYWKTELLPHLLLFVTDLERRRAKALPTVSCKAAEGQCDVTACEFITVCQRNIFKKRSQLLTQKVKQHKRKWTKQSLTYTKGLWNGKHRKYLRRPTRRDRKRKLSSGGHSRRTSRKSSSSRGSWKANRLDPTIWSRLPVELSSKILKMRHEILWSKVMQQLRSLVQMDRPHDKRQTRRTIPKTAVVRASTGPLVQTDPQIATEYIDGYNELHEEFCTNLMLYPFNNEGNFQ